MARALCSCIMSKYLRSLRESLTSTTIMEASKARQVFLVTSTRWTNISRGSWRGDDRKLVRHDHGTDLELAPVSVSASSISPLRDRLASSCPRRIRFGTHSVHTVYRRDLSTDLGDERSQLEELTEAGENAGESLTFENEIPNSFDQEDDLDWDDDCILPQPAKRSSPPRRLPR